MGEQLIDLSCGAFVDALASSAAVPGGGGAAALAGALGAALCSMAGNLTLGRKKYAGVEPDIRRLLERGEGVRKDLLALVDGDAEAFAPLSRAYSLPQDAPDRAETLERATLDALDPPMNILRRCCDGVEMLEEMLEKGSVLLASDVGCGALCCRAAMESAALNIFVNTRTLADREQARRIEAAADGLLEEFVPRAERVAQAVTRRLRDRG